MSVDFSTIKSGLYAWARDESGLADNRIIWADQNAPRPNLPYITLKISSMVKVGDDYIPQPENQAGDINITGNRDFTLSVQAYGDGAFNYLETLRGSLAKESVHSALKAAKIAIVNSEAVLNTTSLVESKYKETAALDIFLRTYSEVIDALSSIDKVEVEATYKNVKNETVINEKYTIDSTI